LLEIPSLVSLLGAFALGLLVALLITLLIGPRGRWTTRATPEAVEALLARGASARQAGQLDEAIQHHTAALDVDEGHLGALFALAEDYQAAGQPAMVREHLRRILSRRPGEPRALTWLRDLTAAEGRWEEAKGIQEQLLRRAATPEARMPENALLSGIRYEAGKVAVAEGRTRDARRLFQEVIRDDPAFVPGYLGLGEALQKLGKRREAVQVWAEGLQRTSALPLLRRLEQNEREAGHPGEMIQLALAALARVPDDPTLTFYLGQVYLDLSMLDEATEQFERLAALAPEIGTFHAYLGSLLERRGKLTEALVEYRQALKIRGVFDLPHRCGECGNRFPGWVDRCERCGRWNSIQPVTCALPPLAPPPPPHGGRQP